MKLTKKEHGLPPELCTKGARAAFNYAGEDPDIEHVRWLGTPDHRANGFTRHDFADLFGTNDIELMMGGPGYLFQALGVLKDGRVALVEAATRGEWVSSSGVAKVSRFLVEMGDYLARSKRSAGDPIHDGRVKLCALLELRLEKASIQSAATEADAAFEKLEETIDGT